MLYCDLKYCNLEHLIMNDDNSVTLQTLLQLALPLGTTMVVGSTDYTIAWAVTVRAQPPAFPDIYGGELALISMDILRSYDNRIKLAEIVQSLATVGVNVIAVKDEITQTTIAVAEENNVAILALPEDCSLTGVERAVNKLIVNQTAQLTQRAIEIQRQLSRLSAENRDLNSMLQLIARATAKPIVLHDDVGVLLSQVYPNVGRRTSTGRALLQNLPYSAFQNWLNRESLNDQSGIMSSPIGFTIILRVEKRIAGYLSIVDNQDALDEFDRLVLTYSGDVCAIELSKNKAIASAVEQARGDWVQMWLSGTPVDDDLLSTRAQQAGFDVVTEYVVAVFRAITESGVPFPLESLTSLVRDDMHRRQFNGAVGQYVDVIVALYPMENQVVSRVRSMVDEVRQQLAVRTPSGLVAAGISRPAQGLSALRECYREAKDALSIANELGDQEQTTFYGDLKLYQLLLALKEHNLPHLRLFYDDSLASLVEHDDRKHGDLVRTLNGFFEANGNLAKAATDLAVHRNTLVYRLERISELTGLDLNDADNRLILHLSLKIQRVLATIPSD